MGRQLDSSTCGRSRRVRGSEPAFITITTGWSSNQARYQLDWTREGWDLTAFDDLGNERFTRTFRTLRDTLETICPTDMAVA